MKKFLTLIMLLIPVLAMAQGYDVKRSASEVIISYDDKTVESIKAPLFVLPNSWSVSSDGKCAAFPLQRRLKSSSDGRASSYAFDTVLVVIINGEKVETKHYDIQFAKQGRDWFDFDHIYTVSANGTRILVSFRTRDTDIRIRSFLAILDLEKQKVSYQPEIDDKLLGVMD